MVKNIAASVRDRLLNLARSTDDDFNQLLDRYTRDRDNYYNQNTDEEGIMEIIVGKNRNGSTGLCRVDFDPSIGRFAGIDRHET